ncbi:MAG: carboxypeptidase regulatory-like domain-containing protein [Bryobacteraceae bacterium]
MDFTQPTTSGRDRNRLAWPAILIGLWCGGLAIPCPAAETTVRIQGTITDKDTGSPVAGAYVLVSDTAGNALSNTSSDSAGSYSFDVPQESAYAVSVSSWTNNGGYYLSNYVYGSTVVVPGDLAEVRTDFALRPGANLILQAYASDGTMLRRAAFFSAVNNHAYATDLNDVPNFGVSSVVNDAYSEDHGWSYDLTVPAFVMPLSTPTRLHVLWEIPSFGKVIVDLDDGGQGYSLSRQGDFRVLNLNRELAASEVARLKREMDDATKAGYNLSGSIADGYNSALAALLQGDALLAAAPADMTAPVAAFNNSLAGALLTQESLYLEKAQTDIPRYRQGKLHLQVRTPDGTPLAGARVSYSQQTHDFQFGGSYLSAQDFPAIGDEFAAAGFNASSVFLSWKDLEPAPGKYDFSQYLDNVCSFSPLLKRGFRMLGAIAYWASSDPSMADSGCPDYWRQMTFEQMKANVRDHMYALAGTYGSRIAPWMISEQNIQNCLGLTWQQKMQVHDVFMDGLHAGFPGAQNLVTGVAMPYGWQQDPFDNSPGVAGGISMPVYLNMLVGGNHALDMIGLEFYHFGVVTVPPYNAPPGWSLAAMARTLDFYAQFGRPVYVEEFQVPSTQEPSSSWWHRPWDPQTQAEFARKFYTLAFSRPSVQDIQWSTQLSDRNSFIRNAGLFDANYQPKPVYYQLRDLIQSWTTSGATTTNAQGEVEIMGFAGDYLVRIAAPGNVGVDVKTHVYEQQDTVAAVTCSLRERGRFR